MKARQRGHEQLLAWARALDDERLWALEDCRHVSGSLERFLLARGERVVRVPPKLMGEARRAAAQRRQVGRDRRARGRARGAARAGAAGRSLAGPEREIRLLLDHREDLVARAHTDPEPAALAPARPRAGARDARPARSTGAAGSSGSAGAWRARADRAGADLPRARRPLQRADPRASTSSSASCEPLAARAGAARCSSCPAAVRSPPPSCVGEIAGVNRFASDAQLAKHAGVAPLPASSRQHAASPAQPHRATVSSTAPCTGSRSPKAACHPPARAYLARKQAEGKSRTRSAPPCAPSSGRRVSRGVAAAGRARLRRNERVIVRLRPRHAQGRSEAAGAWTSARDRRILHSGQDFGRRCLWASAGSRWGVRP